MNERGLDPSSVVKLTMLISASWLARAVQIAAKLKLGEILADGPLGIDAIARRTATDPVGSVQPLPDMSHMETSV